MKIFKKFFLNACMYSVLILTLFYAFAAVSEMSEAVMTVDKYFTILGFGAVISASVLIFDTKINFFLKYAINYAVLLTAFSVIFLTSSGSSENAVARVFVAVVLFTIIYALALLFTYLFKILWTKKAKAAGGKNVNRKV